MRCFAGDRAVSERLEAFFASFLNRFWVRQQEEQLRAVEARQERQALQLAQAMESNSEAQQLGKQLAEKALQRARELLELRALETKAPRGLSDRARIGGLARYRARWKAGPGGAADGRPGAEAGGLKGGGFGAPAAAAAAE